MMPWIENVSYGDLEKGFHYDAGENSMSIQIVDPGMEFPTPKYHFKEVRQFYFLDVDDTDHDKFYFSAAITNEDAKGIADALQHAKHHSMNVIVSCVMGVCRSGAVTEVGVAMGFQDTEKYRIPNTMVKRMLMLQLGMAYSPSETPRGAWALDEHGVRHYY